MSATPSMPDAPLPSERYRVDGLLGDGGTGRVHRAWDTRLGRRVAIKVLAPELAADPTFVARLREEGRHLAALAHPNLVALHDIEEGPAGTCLVMELVEGDTLGARLRREGPLAVREVASIVTGIAAALSALHGSGIVHGDVSPANILLGIDGRARLADLGLARDLSPGSIATDGGLEADGRIRGTLRYLAPEQLEGAAATPASDVHALAAVTYAALVGRPPAVATDVAGLLAAHREPPIRPSLLRPGLGPALDEVLLTALGPAAARPTAYRFAVALAGAARTCDDPIGEPDERTTLMAPELGVAFRGPRHRARMRPLRRTALALAAGGLLLGVGGVALSALEGSPARPVGPVADVADGAASEEKEALAEPDPVRGGEDLARTVAPPPPLGVPQPIGAPAADLRLAVAARPRTPAATTRPATTGTATTAAKPADVEVTAEAEQDDHRGGGDRSGRSGRSGGSTRGHDRPGSRLDRHATHPDD